MAHVPWRARLHRRHALGPAALPCLRDKSVHDYQRDFIELALRREVLRFGEFTLKSGRQSPYFFNMGRIDSGAALAQLGRAYAAAVVDAGIEVDVLFGDDVMTAGTAVRESLALIRAHGAEPAGVLIALDRQERGHGERSAAQEVAAGHGIPVIAITTLDDVLAYAGEQPQLAAQHARLLAYRARYGVQP